jgi:two-component system, response regulator PdtaR
VRNGGKMQAIYIWASSEPNPGPRPIPRAADDITPAPNRNRILVIEDDPVVSLGIEQLLAEAGYVVLASCARGEEALSLAERHRPDLILADVKLAGAMDGIEAVATIRAERDVPVIFVTAHTDARTRARMTAVGPAEILAKPVPDLLLLHAVAAALRRERPQ